MSYTANSIVGFVIQDVFLGVGSMFELDIGGKLSASVARSTGRACEWRLWVECSEWIISKDSILVACYESDRQIIENVLRMIKRLSIIECKVDIENNNEVTYMLTEGFKIHLNLHTLGVEYDNWCLFTPSNDVLIQDGVGRLFIDK